MSETQRDWFKLLCMWPRAAFSVDLDGDPHDAMDLIPGSPVLAPLHYGMWQSMGILDDEQVDILLTYHLARRGLGPHQVAPIILWSRGERRTRDYVERVLFRGFEADHIERIGIDFNNSEECDEMLGEAYGSLSRDE